MSKGGRPSKLTEEVKQKLTEALENGNSLEPSCAYAGISYQTFRNWLERGESEGKGEYFEFFEEVQRAIATAEIKLVAKINQDKDWKSAAWILERRHSDRWAANQKIKVEVEKQMEAAIDILKAKLPPEIYDKVLEVWANTEDDEN